MTLHLKLTLANTKDLHRIHEQTITAGCQFGDLRENRQVK